MKIIQKNYIEENLKILEELELKQQLIEAGFLGKDISKGFQLICNQIQKRTGHNCNIMPFVREYQNEYGIFESVSLIVGNKIEVRFNMLKGHKDTNSIHTIDIYYNIAQAYPDVTLSLEGYNILQTLDEIEEYIKNPHEINNIKETKLTKTDDFQDWVNNENINDNELVNSKKNELYIKYDKYAKHNNLTVISFPTFNKELDGFLKKKGLSNKYNRLRKIKVSKEKPILSPENQALVDFVNKEMSNDLTTNLELLKADIKLVAKGINKNYKNLLLVSGEAGISKTVTIKEAVKELNVPYSYTRLQIKNLGDFHKLLYANQGKILILDDSNDIIKKSSKFLMQMLAITDIPENRRLSYINNLDPEIKSESNPKGQYPQNFTWTGALICITNLPMPSIHSAFKDRAIVNIVESTSQSILQAIEDGLEKFYKEIPMKVKKDTLQFLIDFEGSIQKLSFRTYEGCLGYFETLPESLARTVCVKKMQQGIL